MCQLAPMPRDPPGPTGTVSLVLDRVRIAGFRSFADATVELRRLNVLVGANGKDRDAVVTTMFGLYGNAARPCTACRR